MAAHWGAALIDSDGQRVTGVEAHPLDPDPSVIGQGFLAATECRVMRPAIRRSWLEGGPGTDGDRRGHDPFVEVSWDRALDLAAAELARVRDEHGHSAVYGASYGWGSAGRFHFPTIQIARFLRMFGGYTDGRGTYSASAAEAIVPYIYGMPYSRAIASQTSWSQIAANTDLVVSFGGLRISNAQVTFGGQGPHHLGRWLRAGRARGIDFVNVSPLADDQLDDLDAHWIALRPGTDVALMAALIHTIVTDGRADDDFLDRYTHGWSELWAHLAGHDDGVARSARWAADITGLAESEIVALARRMVAGRTLINLSLSIQRADHGEQTYWMALALASVIGQIGLPGGGISFPMGSNGSTGSGQVRKRVPGLPVPPRPAEVVEISTSRIVELLERPGEVFHFDGRADVHPDVKLVYWAGGNPFHHHQDLNRLRRAWARPDTVIVHEPYWTATAKRADIVFPVTGPLERDDLGGADSMLVAMTKAIEPVGEARHDYDVFSGLAARLGFGSDFTEGRTAEEWIRHLYDRFAADNDGAPDFDTFWADGFLQHDMPTWGETEQVFLGPFRADPHANALATPSGRLELASATIEGFGYHDCAGHPQWYEPYERLGGPGPEAARYGLHLVSNQPSVRLHSQYDHAPISQATKVAGREPIRIHPDAAAARGIVNGGVVRVFNDRGSCLAGVVVSDRVAPTVVQMATGAWYDPDAAGMCKHGNPNVLTRDKGTSQLAQGPTAHTCLVEVEPWQGPLPPVTAHEPPELISDDG